MGNSAAKIALLSDNLDLLCVAAVGGIVLFGFHIAGHFNRAPADKLPWHKYMLFFAFLLISLPSLALIMTAVYILNGDKMGVMLAFQVGVSSPAIAQSLIVKTANQLGKGTKATIEPGQ